MTRKIIISFFSWISALYYTNIVYHSTENHDRHTQRRSCYRCNRSSYAPLLFVRKYGESYKPNGDHWPAGKDQCFRRRLQVQLLHIYSSVVVETWLAEHESAFATFATSNERKSLTVRNFDFPNVYISYRLTTHFLLFLNVYGIHITDTASILHNAFL